MTPDVVSVYPDDMTTIPMDLFKQSCLEFLAQKQLLGEDALLLAGFMWDEDLW